MNAPPSSLVEYLIIIAIIPSNLLPILFFFAFNRLWQRFNQWSFRAMSFGCLFAMIGQLCSFLAKNIPRFGKTESELVSIQDNTWLFNSSIIAMFIALVLLFVGVIALIRALKKFDWEISQ